MTDRLVALLPDAIARWDAADPVLARIAREYPPPARPLTEGGDAFHSLVTSIVHQQVSLASGAALMRRLTDAVGGTLTPAAIVQAGEDALRAGGMSGQKTRYLLDLSRRVRDGTLDLDALARLPDDEVERALTAVKGIGAWTAKMFLLFHLDRPDVLPHEDLGVRIAVADAYGVPREAAAAHMRTLAPAWSPFASVASLVLWNWRRARKDAKPCGTVAGTQ